MISKEVYMDVRAMKRSGKSIRAIARELGLHRQTVKKHLERADFPQYRKDKRKDGRPSASTRTMSSAAIPS